MCIKQPLWVRVRQPNGVNQFPTVIRFSGLEDICGDIKVISLPIAVRLMFSGLGALFGMAATKKFDLNFINNVDEHMKNINEQAICSCRNLPYQQLEMSLTYLMSRYAAKPCKHLAHAVIHHLEMLVDNTDPSLSNEKRKHYSQLYNYWWLQFSNSGTVLDDKKPKQECIMIFGTGDSALRH